MSRHLCDCLGACQALSRIMKTMRHCWNIIFFITLRIMIWLNQLALMAPFICTTKRQKISPEYSKEMISTKLEFRTNRLVTVINLVISLTLMAAIPYLVLIIPDLYNISRQKEMGIFQLIAQFCTAVDAGCTTLIMISQIINRKRVVELLNLYAKIIEIMQYFEKNFVTFKIFFTLMLEFGMTVYNVWLSIPFITSATSRLNANGFCAYAALMFMNIFTSIFALGIFTLILVILALSQQLERQLSHHQNIWYDEKIIQLIRMQDAIHHLMSSFVKTMQFAIFCYILMKFTTILCNIYTLLDYYATNQKMYPEFLVAIASVVLELYSIILMSYLCRRSQQKVRDLVLIREDQYFLKLPDEIEFVDNSVLWPQLQEFLILGLFPLNNEFALFLLSYSVNFIVIILQFHRNRSTNL